MKASWINQQILGFTVLLSLTFQACEDVSAYTLVMDLAESEARGSRAISIEFLDVARLSLSGFGGGLTQLLRLRVKDVSDKQWDRVVFEISELEREAIAFTCKKAVIVRNYRVGE